MYHDFTDHFTISRGFTFFVKVARDVLRYEDWKLVNCATYGTVQAGII